MGAEIVQEIALLFLAVFALNVIPAFSPPTWVAMSVVGVHRPDANPLLLAGVAAVAATSGRMLLATLSERLVRNKLLSEGARANIDVLRRTLLRRRARTAGAMLVYAFSPLPSNYLFIAYGLTRLPLHVAAIPFLFGRFVSYAGWTFVAQSLSVRFAENSRDPRSFFNGYFVLTQLAAIAALVLFTRVDWAALIDERKLRLVKRRQRPPG